MTSIAFLGVGHIHTPGFINMLKKRNDISVKSVWDHHKVRGQQRADELDARFIGDVKTILADPEIKKKISEAVRVDFGLARSL